MHIVHIVDAVVVLDLLQGLADELKTFDLTDQCKLMLAKYKLLSTKITLDNTSESYKAVARALQDGKHNKIFSVGYVIKFFSQIVSFRVKALTGLN